jgi:hypothetical protein
VLVCHENALCESCWVVLGIIDGLDLVLGDASAVVKSHQMVVYS